jgi:type II secretory pathway pseudopilin PulG
VTAIEIAHKQSPPRRAERIDIFYSFIIKIRNCLKNMAILEFLLVIGLGGFAGLLIVNNLNESKQKRQLDEAFYQLLETQNSQMSLIQLAASARVEAEVAQQYLNRQVKIFSAILEVDEEGDTFYRFPRLRLPPSSGKEW